MRFGVLRRTPNVPIRSCGAPYSLYEHADGDEHDRGHHGHHHQGGDRLLLLVGGHHGQEVGVLAACPHVPRVAPVAGQGQQCHPWGAGTGSSPTPLGKFQAEIVHFGCFFPAKLTLKLGVVLAPRRTGHVPPRGAAAGILSPPSPYGSTPRTSCGTSRSSGSSLGGSAAPHPCSKAKFVL